MLPVTPSLAAFPPASPSGASQACPPAASAGRSIPFVDPALTAPEAPIHWLTGPGTPTLHAVAKCGRITQKSNANRLGLGLTTVTLIEPLQLPPVRYNGAPGQDHWVIRQHPKTGERTLDRLWWGLIPYWVKEANGGRKPINAKAETVASLPSFRDAYWRRRCLLPIDSSTFQFIARWRLPIGSSFAAT